METHIRFKQDGSLPIAVFSGGAKSESLADNETFQPIYCQAPMLGTPVDADSHIVIWLDSNILSRAQECSSNANLQAFVNWANEEQLELNPLLAILEKYRSNVSEEKADSLVIGGLTCLKDSYGARIDIDSIKSQLPLMKSVAKSINGNDYIKFLTPFLVPIKYFYNRADLNLAQKCEEFAKLMSEKLPISIAILGLACLYFLVGEKRILFDKKLSKKIRDDMKIKATEQDNLDAIQNLASDFAYFTATTALPKPAGESKITCPIVATTDRGLAFTIRQLCYYDIYIKEDGVGYGVPGYRPHSIAHNEMDAIVRHLVDKYLGEDFSSERQQRLINQKNINEIILRSNFLKIS